MIPNPVYGGDADNLAGESGLLGGREAVALVCAFLGADAERTAQRYFDPFGEGCKICLTIKRCENGAAHECSAAQCGQDRAGKPLYRNATAIDIAARSAVNREWRFIAELNGVGLPRSICAA
jgi:hypothetical protein